MSTQQPSVARTRTTESYHYRVRGDVLSWFKDHRARVVEKGRISRIEWRNANGSGFYYVDYVGFDGRLVATGDMGDAVYQVYSPVDLKWWAGCDLGYFASKCMASEEGRGYKSWDGEYAELYLRDLARDADPAKVRVWDQNGAWEAVNARFDWQQWLGEFGGEAFGDDFYEFANIGMVVDRRCMGHLFGLQLAYHQLEGRPLPKWMTDGISS